MTSIYSIVLTTFLLVTAKAFAEKEQMVTLHVKGMHCSSCVKTLTKKVCKDFSLNSCEVKLTNKKNELGEINFVNASGASLDEIRAAISKAGYEVVDKP